MPAALPPAIAAPMEPQSEQFPATPTNGTAPAFQTPGMVGTAQRFCIEIVQEVAFRIPLKLFVYVTLVCAKFPTVRGFMAK